MPLDNNFQTILYYSDTGDIREILPNQYIKSRKHLNRFIGMQESTGISFFYLLGNYPIDPKDYIIQLPTKTRPPKLLTIDGKDPGLNFFRDAARWTIQNNDKIVISFEGGMGDYLVQADTVIQLHKEYPEKMFYVSIEHSNRSKVLGSLGGWDGIGFLNPENPAVSRAGRLDMKNINRVQGYAPIGKIGVYSGLCGLSRPAPRAALIVKAEDKNEALALISNYTKTKHPFVIILHTMSGNCNAKSIKNDVALKLLAPILDMKNILILHIGGAGERPIDHPKIKSLQGTLPWDKVVSIMSVANACFCIDSGILHIAQHLLLPTISFWGPTDPVNILGMDPGVNIIISSSTCAGCDLWMCTKDECMRNFNPEMITSMMAKIRGE